MKRLRTTLLVLFGMLGSVAAQMPSFGNFGDVPVEITAEGETRFEGGVAIAEDNVQIHFKDISIYCDYAEYNPDTRDVLLVGNVRIYQEKVLLNGQRALYNLETKQVRALQFTGEYAPMKFHALSMRAPSMNEFRLRDAEFTLEDSSEPTWKMKSKSVRIYPDNRVVFSRSTLYVKNIPIFWFPYVFGYTNNSGIIFSPGFYSSWGGYLLTGYTFPVGSSNNFLITPRLDYRTKKGIALGLDSEFHFGKADRSTGTFKFYYAWDQDPGDIAGGPAEPPEGGITKRYRISFKHQLYLTDDIYATFDINKLSDRDMMEDFFPAEFRVDPQPDTFISLTKWNEWYTITLLTRWQMNDFQKTVERLPELDWDIKQSQLFGLPVNYDGTTGVSNLRQAFPENDNPLAILPEDYQAVRFDTFHQLSLPHTFFNFLSVIPKVGFRGTYYSESGHFVSSPAELFFAQDNAEQLAEEQNPFNVASPYLNKEGGIFRPIVNAGIESSFKFWKIYEKAQARWMGLDGLLHVTQPYVNYSWVHNMGPSMSKVLQFDRLIPSTQLPPIDFPQFNMIDSLESWSILRTGIRNRLYTRRDEGSHRLVELDNFVDFNFDNPYTTNAVSNFYTKLRVDPVNWFFMEITAQMPVDSMIGGLKEPVEDPNYPKPILGPVNNNFTQMNTSLTFMPVKQVYLRFAHRYLYDNPYYNDTSRLSATGFWWINDNWAVSARGDYAFEVDQLLYHEYTIHRDLTNWVMSVGVAVRNNVNYTTQAVDSTEYGVMFTMTLKDAPQISMPLTFDQGTDPLSGE